MQNEIINSLLLESSFAKYRSVKELDAAINDLLSNNYFSLAGKESGPYAVVISNAENRLILDIRPSAPEKEGQKIHMAKIIVPLRSFRSVVKDYFLVCESYQQTLESGLADRLEAIDMGRRSLHNEGAEIFLKLMENKINTDFETARRFFTIITVLHMQAS